MNQPENDQPPDAKTPISIKEQLPSPITHQESTSSSSDQYKESTATPEEGRPSQIQHREHNPLIYDLKGLGSPPQDSHLQDTQAFSQIPNANALSVDVKDEMEEGVWGYLLPVDQKGKTLVMRKRNACPLPRGMENFGKDGGNRQSKKGKGKDFEAEEEAYEETKLQGIASGGVSNAFFVSSFRSCCVGSSQLSRFSRNFELIQSL